MGVGKADACPEHMGKEVFTGRREQPWRVLMEVFIAFDNMETELEAGLEDWKVIGN